jgi:hypothetical protein
MEPVIASIAPDHESTSIGSATETVEIVAHWGAFLLLLLLLFFIVIGIKGVRAIRRRWRGVYGSSFAASSFESRS